jgi:colanic acid biosynthesis glycosyl transferase WcaI
VPPDKAVLIPNWVDTEEIRPLARSNPFADEHELASSFVVSYAGNMGWAQNIDELIAAASELRDSDSIRFLLVGDGVEKHRLQQAIFDLNLPNVTMLDHQPYAQVPLIYASSDLSYVALHAGLDADALPSKVYRIMASGRAVLAVAEKTSGLALLIEDSGCGFVVEPGSPAELGRVILDASRDRDRVEAMGLAGRSYVEEHFARQLVVGQYASLIEDLVGGSER